MVNQHVEIKGWESFALVEFNLGPLLQGQTSIAKIVPGNSLSGLYLRNRKV